MRQKIKQQIHFGTLYAFIRFNNLYTALNVYRVLSEGPRLEHDTGLMRLARSRPRG